LTNFAFNFFVASLAQDFAGLEPADLMERVDKDRRFPAASAFRDVFALEMAFSRARSCSCLSRDMDTPKTFAVFRAVAKGALISVAID
jgi:hypothetical protein